MWIISELQNSASGCCLAFAWFFANFSLALLIKKACTSIKIREIQVQTSKQASKQIHKKIKSGDILDRLNERFSERKILNKKNNHCKFQIKRDHLISTYAKLSEKPTFLTP